MGTLTWKFRKMLPYVNRKVNSIRNQRVKFDSFMFYANGTQFCKDVHIPKVVSSCQMAQKAQMFWGISFQKRLKYSKNEMFGPEKSV